MVWDRDDYVKEAQMQLGDGNGYRKVKCREKLLSELVDKGNFFKKELKIGLSPSRKISLYML